MQSHEPFDVMAVLEADDMLLAETCTYSGLPMWLRMRELFYFSCGQMTYAIPAPGDLAPALGRKKRVKHGLARLVNTLAPARRTVQFLPAKAVLTPGLDGPLVMGAGRLVGQAPAHCSLLLNTDAVPMQDLRPSRRYPKVFYSRAAMAQQQKVDGSAAQMDAFQKAFETLTAMVDTRLEAELGHRFDPETWARIRAYLVASGQRFQGAVAGWRRLLSRRKPRCIVLEDGPYLAQQPIVAAARALGIKSADLQHGSLDCTHAIYNLGPGLLRSGQLPNMFPDLFLARGEHWTRQTNLPWTSIILGHPDRTVVQRQDHGQLCVLVIGQLPNDYFLNLATELSRLLPENYRVIYRPHPSQRNVDQAALPVSERLGLDLGKPLFAALAETSHLVGEHSTVIFEALGIVPEIYIRRTRATEAILRQFPFAQFGTVDDLARRILKGAPTQIDAGQFWAPNWELNLEKFVSSVNGAGKIGHMAA